MAFAIFLDRAKPESAIYDKSGALSVDAFLPSFKGWRITSTQPLTIEYYSDTFAADAELNVLPLSPWFPSRSCG